MRQKPVVGNTAGATVDFQGLLLAPDRRNRGIDYRSTPRMAEHQLKQIVEQAPIVFGCSP
jgi:hypothetical protein